MLPAVLFALLFAVLWAAYHLVLPAAWRLAGRALAGLTRALLRRQRFSAWYERGSPRLRTLHPYRPLMVIAAAGFVAAAITGAAFLQLAEMVQARSSGLESVDHRVWAAARELRTPDRTAFFTAWTVAGTPVGLGIVVFSVAIALYVRGRRYLPLFLVLASVGGYALNGSLKVLFARARPDLTLALRNTSGYSFPSGHAMMSIVAYGALAYVALRLLASPGLRSAAVALASAAAAAVGLSRVYLGVHWVSDIVAGVAAGIVWLATTIAVYEAFRRLRVIRRSRSTA